MATPMKGLTQFIADMRAVKSHEAEKSRVNEELANIRQKFRDTSLNNYNKRKYVAKLIYIYILGYSVDFGHNEALALMNMTKFSEKQIGYLAVGLMLNGNEKVVEQAIPASLRDMDSISELNTGLALNFLSTIRTPHRNLAPSVYRLLVSPTSSPSVQRKAALVLLHFYRLDDTVISREWLERIIALLDNPNIGVALSVAALVKILAVEDAGACLPCFPTVVRRLDAIYSHKRVDPDYVYYDVPAPWFTIKLLEIVELYTGYPRDEVLDSTLRQVVKQVISWALKDMNEPHASPQHKNARNAVFFEALNLIDEVREIVPAVKAMLLELLGTDKDASSRYLALNALTAFTIHREQTQTRELLDVVLGLLKDRDISVRKKALDVLYHVCTSKNVEHVAAELLEILSVSEVAIRQEIVSVLAVLIEKYATNSRWYVDTTLSLLVIGSIHVDDKVASRLIQIVVNNEDIQTYTARAVLEYLKQGRCSDNMLRVGAYILGEFGQLIATDPECAPTDLFLILQDNIDEASDPTKYVLLTTYIKFANLFPELRPRIQEVFDLYSSSQVVELQQRACEYSNMLKQENVALLPVVWEEMPPFSERETTLLSRLGKSKPALMRRDSQLRRQATGYRRQESPLKSMRQESPLKLRPIPPASRASVAGYKAPLGSPTKERPSRNMLSASTTGSLSSAEQNKSILLSSNWEHGFRHMLTHIEGTLYQDALLQVACKYEFRRHLGCVILYLKNTSARQVTSINVQLTNPMGQDVLVVATKNMPAASLSPGKVTELVIICEVKQPFAVSPVCRVTYVAGAFAEMSFKLPIVIERFMEPVDLSYADFQARWDQIGSTGEFQKTFKNWSTSKMRSIIDDDRGVLQGLNYGIVGVDPTGTLCGAGILHTLDGGNYGCLIKVRRGTADCGVTTRSTNKLVAVVLAKNLTNAYQL